MLQNSVKKFGLINTVEGYSYLLLVLIAMPLKYLLGIAIAVKIAGLVHGVFFVMFCFLLVIAWQDAKWSFKESVLFFVASLIPFGTFYTKKTIASYE